MGMASKECAVASGKLTQKMPSFMPTPTQRYHKLQWPMIQMSPTQAAFLIPLMVQHWCQQKHHPEDHGVIQA